jgi:DNA-binding transcriptional regulator YiaG
MPYNSGMKYAITPTELRTARQASGQTLAGVAEKIGVSESAVSRWESGSRKIPGPAARLLKKILKIPQNHT